MAEGFFLGRPVDDWLNEVDAAKSQNLESYNTEADLFFNGIADALVGNASAAPAGGEEGPAAGARGGGKGKPGGAKAGGRGKAKDAPSGGIDMGEAIADIGNDIVATAEKTADGVVKAKEKEVKGKKDAEDGYSAFSSALQGGLVAGMAQSATSIGNAFTTLVLDLKNGTADVGETFKVLAAEMGKNIINAVGEGLIQMGAGKLAEGTAQAIVMDPRAGTQFIAGGLLAAAGGVIKGLAAAFLEEGGVVTRPTLAFVGEGGQSEAVIPLDRLSEFAVTGGALRVQRFEAEFPGISNHSVLSAALRETEARRFVMDRQVANRRIGRRIN